MYMYSIYASRASGTYTDGYVAKLDAVERLWTRTDLLELFLFRTSFPDVAKLDEEVDNILSQRDPEPSLFWTSSLTCAPQCLQLESSAPKSVKFDISELTDSNFTEQLNVASR